MAASATLDLVIQYYLKGRQPNAATRAAIPTATPKPHYTPSRTPAATRPRPWTPTPRPTFTPAIDYALFVDAWKTYRDDVNGFTFEYPAIYDEPAYADWCRTSADEYGVHIGQRSYLSVESSDGLGLQAYVDRLFADCHCSVEDIVDSLCECNVMNQSAKMVNGLPAVTVEYMFGGVWRFGTTTLIEDQGRIFHFSFTAGAYCDVPEIGLGEINAYVHMIESFHLVK